MGVAAFLHDVEKLLLVAHPRLQFAGVGRKGKDGAGSPPRIVWFVTDVGHAAPEKQKQGTTPKERAETPRHILTRRVTIVAVVWGKNLEDTEELVSSTIGALHHIAYGSVAFGGETWPEDENVNDGIVAELTFGVSTPVNARRFLVADAAADSKFTATQATSLGVDNTNAP